MPQTDYGHLVVSRKVGEKVVIGRDPPVTVEVVEIRGEKIRLLIAAPKDMPVHRLEVAEAIESRQLLESMADASNTAVPTGEPANVLDAVNRVEGGEG